MAWPRPLRATESCRHYGYDNGSGPACALGLDLTAPGASRRCWSDDRTCPSRADYTDEERAAWKTWLGSRLARLRAALGVLPRPIPLRTTGTVPCPSCASVITYSRWERGASVACGTPDCCAAQFNIAAGADWPTP